MGANPSYILLHQTGELQRRIEALGAAHEPLHVVPTRLPGAAS